MNQRPIWNDFAGVIAPQLGEDDDPQLWRAAIEEVFRDAEFLCQHATTSATIYAQVGICSHWLSPHNGGSWLPDARYAWPSGYGGSGHSIVGLPEFDWFHAWHWDHREHTWNPTTQPRGKRPLTFRVTIPARTARHNRAVVHAQWTPGSPTLPHEKLVDAYGFLNRESDWECTSTRGRGKAYEVNSGG